MNTETNLIITDPDMEVIKLEKESAYDFRKRRHSDWRDNYTLYRDKVIPNRLIQRQSVNIPLMKYALGSLMKEVDEPPTLYFKNLDNNQQKEVFYNEYWKEMGIRQKLTIKDIIDKKQALLYGRSFKKLNIEGGQFTFEIIDPQDMLVHRFVDPANLDTAKVVIQTDIYRTLSEIVKNADYKSSGRKKLKTYYTEQQSTLEQDETLNKMADKGARMSDMGLEDAMTPLLGEVYIELNEVYRREWSEEEGQEIYFLYTIATPGGAVVELQKQKLYEVIGPTVDNFWYDHLPISTWATDPERTDFWSDSKADVIRGSNQVLNSWTSQLVENRTLRNYNMHYYDSTNAEFVPQTYDPVPWGWYPVPGNPNELITTVEVPDLSESIDEIDYIIKLAEKAVATTSAQTGSVEGKQVTLGEVQLALANAQERARSISLFYTESWKDFGMKYIKMLEASGDDIDPVTITKSGRLGKKMYQKEISPKSWHAKSGYKVEVKMLGEKLNEDVDTIQKLNATRESMPNNAPLKKIYNKKLLEFAGLSTEEIQQVMEFEDQYKAPVAPPEAGGEEAQEIPGVPAVAGAPVAQAPNVA